ncbi:outer membrane protein assembly factor BamD [Nitratidesulfovibrio vulgaris]|nr:outer membrane protein assembly factor BamD [Nitratidesulfovibrio vulgaris]GEB79495.1 outer membrane protein assembly factor BamD [Desulfovibrio desulfuricans]HBW16456.1 outer membrane protein assembly factor BamD [Desulfovibrio sp.]ABM28343.1 putative lipoprotein [Nitratidesulfovibrio vulgaris DP4]ADP86623.1 outer membrane assembly lipoprotein YfiO [Nitratidesulfovibrio vulgaris RCH1]WCB45322.1 outer membrane protein assembly factor BamD [Nitratidesulfovibrio vulgaris]
MRKTLLRAACMAALTFMLSGCGIIDYFYLPPPEDTAQELYESGNDAMREKDYVAAAQAYTRLKDNYPFSPYTIEAELSLADAYFLDEEYPAAAEAYKEFETLHPRHQAIPYVLYQVGMARLKSFISVDRPVNNVQEAYQYFQRLRESYPGTEYAAKAEEHMKECRRLLAERELFIADVYWRTGKYGAAWQRYSFVRDNFKDVPHAVEYATEKANVAYLRHREAQSENIREAREGSWKQWFKWL